jgi:hypothetical protein
MTESQFDELKKSKKKTKNKTFFLDSLSVEDGNDTLSRNFGTGLPLYAA